MTEGPVPKPGGKPSGQADAFDRVETVHLDGHSTNDAQARADRLEEEARTKSGRFDPALIGDEGESKDYIDALAAMELSDAETNLEEVELDRIETVAGMMVRDLVGAVYAKLNSGQRARIFELVPSGQETILSSKDQNKVMYTLLREFRYLARSNDDQDPRYILVISYENRDIKHLVRKPTFRETPPGMIRNQDAPILPPMETSELLGQLAWMEEVTTPEAGAKGEFDMSSTKPEPKAPAGAGGGFAPTAGFDTALGDGSLPPRSVGDTSAGDTRSVALSKAEIDKIGDLAGPVIASLAAQGLLANDDMMTLSEMAERDDQMLTRKQAEDVLKRARGLNPISFDAALEKRGLTIDMILNKLEGGAGFTANDLLGPSDEGELTVNADLPRDEDEVADDELILTDESGGAASGTVAPAAEPPAKPADRSSSGRSVVVLGRRSPEAIAAEGKKDEPDPPVRPTARRASSAPPLSDEESGEADLTIGPGAAPLPKSATGRYDRERLIGEGAREPLTEEEQEEREPEVAPAPPAKPSRLKRIGKALLWVIVLLIFVVLAAHAYLVHRTGQPPKMPTEASVAAIHSLLNPERTTTVAAITTQTAELNPLTMVKPSTAVRRGEEWVLFGVLTSSLAHAIDFERDLAPMEITYVERDVRVITLVSVTSSFRRDGKIVLRVTIAVPKDKKVDGQVLDLTKIHFLPVVR